MWIGGESSVAIGQVEAHGLELNLAVVTNVTETVNSSSRPNPVLSNCEEKFGDGLSIMSDLFIFGFYRNLEMRNTGTLQGRKEHSTKKKKKD